MGPGSSSLTFSYLLKAMITKGKLLIAEPFLGDPNFERSVTLVCDHDEKGTFGLTLNQATHLMLADVLQDTIYPDIPVYLGGPVQQNTIHFIHRVGHLIKDGIEVCEKLFWSGDFEQLKTLLNLGTVKSTDVRFFIGYAGWSAGQLENELQQQAWIITDAHSDFIFDTPADQCWRSILRKMDGKYKQYANYPTDPRLN
jgi:putative transcriptional regulator